MVSKLRVARISKGLKQSDVADIIGINTARYNGYENGRNAIPLDVAVKISDALSISFSDFFIPSKFTVCEVEY